MARKHISGSTIGWPTQLDNKSMDHYQRMTKIKLLAQSLKKMKLTFWQIQDIPFHLPKQITQHIKALPLSQSMHSLEDIESWKLTSNGQFTIKLAYLFILNNSKNSTSLNLQTRTNYSWIWNPRQQFFLWQAYTKSLCTNSSLLKTSTKSLWIPSTCFEGLLTC